MVANYTNKHITFNKGQCIGQVEPTNDKMPQTPVNSVTMQKMMDDKVQPDTFTPFALSPFESATLPRWILRPIQTQFVKDKTSSGMTNLALLTLYQTNQSL